jgi:hypothetical protein
MWRVVTVSILSGAVALVACLYFTYRLFGENQDAEAISWNADTARIELGDATRLHQGVQMRLGEEGRGVVTLPSLAISSSAYPILQLQAASISGGLTAYVLWRNAITGEKVHFHQVPGNVGGSTWVNMGALDNWSGTITAVAIMIAGQPGDQATISHISILPASPSRQLQLIAADWTSFNPWTHASINFHSGTGSPDSSTFPVPITAMLFAFSIVAYAFIYFSHRARKRFDWHVVAAIFLVCWIALDLLWQQKLVRQLTVTYDTFYGKNPQEKLAAGFDAGLVNFATQVKEHLGQDSPRVFVTSSSDYLGMRGAYYLYPHNVFWKRFARTLPGKRHLQSGDHIVIIEPTEITFDSSAGQLQLPGKQPIGIEPIFAHPAGKLFRVK